MRVAKIRNTHRCLGENSASAPDIPPGEFKDEVKLSELSSHTLTLAEGN